MAIRIFTSFKNMEFAGFIRVVVIFLKIKNIKYSKIKFKNN